MTKEELIECKAELRRIEKIYFTELFKKRGLSTKDAHEYEKEVIARVTEKICAGEAGTTYSEEDLTYLVIQARMEFFEKRLTEFEERVGERGN